MTKRKDTKKPLYHGHEVVQVSDSPFPSLPLFLPANITYDPATNTVSAHDEAGDVGKEGKEDLPADLHLVKVPNAGWDMLEGLKVPISVISCVGPYRTGKSLLMSRFLETSNAFQIGPTLEGCTRGIWISTSALKDPETGCYKFLLDVEGLGDPLSGDDASNARLALACLLLSNVFLFNSTSHPDRGSLQFLRCLSTIRQRIPESPSFPSFVWIFRDFFLQLPRRRDSNEVYTLKEFVTERVLHAPGGDIVEARVVDSLLNDFCSLDVLSVGHPKLKGQQPLGPEDMAHLGDLEWDALDDGFRADMDQVIKTSLERAKPFQFASEKDSHEKKGWGLFSRQSDPACVKGKAYTKWCDTVLELVNSTGTIPHLPDLQHQLIQQMADEQLAQSIDTFGKELHSYWDSCPTFNVSFGETAELVASRKLMPVAEETELKSRANDLFEQQKRAVSDSGITSATILTNTLSQLEARCLANADNSVGDTVALSIYEKVRSENLKRSQAACEALAASLYDAVQASIRNDPTSMPVKEFETVVARLRRSYELQARGPAKDQVLTSHLLHPSDSDLLFIAKVTEKDDELRESLVLQASLSKDIQDKVAELDTLSNSFAELKVQKALEMEALSKAADEALQKALKEQEERERKQREELRVQMEQQLQEAKEKADKDLKDREAHLKRMEEEAELRLQTEVQARDERLKREQELFEKQIESLKASADAELHRKLEIVESTSREEQEKIELEMKKKLQEAEERLKQEILERDAELSKARLELKAKENEKAELKARLEKRICPNCNIL